VVLYEMLSGELPFKGEHEQAIIHSILKEKPKSITELKADIPQSIEQVVLRALEKDASYAPAYVGRAWVWLVRNQIGFVSPEEARPKAKAAAQRAVELDPFNPLVHIWYACVLYSRRRYEEAIAAAKEAQRIQPDFPLAANALWIIMHEKKGMERESLEAAKVFVKTTYNAPGIEAVLDEGYAQGGYAEAMMRGAEFLIALLPGTFCLPTDIASFYIMAGEKDKAIEWLEKGLEIYDSAFLYLGFPCWDDIRPDPRFQDILRRVGLPVDKKE
jgi:tetratricopeptide (TPR) repeat protein